MVNYLENLPSELTIKILQTIDKTYLKQIKIARTLNKDNLFGTNTEVFIFLLTKQSPWGKVCKIPPLIFVSKKIYETTSYVHIKTELLQYIPTPIYWPSSNELNRVSLMLDFLITNNDILNLSEKRKQFALKCFAENFFPIHFDNFDSHPFYFGEGSFLYHKEEESKIFDQYRAKDCSAIFDQYSAFVATCSYNCNLYIFRANFRIFNAHCLEQEQKNYHPNEVTKLVICYLFTKIEIAFSKHKESDNKKIFDNFLKNSTQTAKSIQVLKIIKKVQHTIKKMFDEKVLNDLERIDYQNKVEKLCISIFLNNKLLQICSISCELILNWHAKIINGHKKAKRIYTAIKTTDYQLTFSHLVVLYIFLYFFIKSQI